MSTLMSNYARLPITFAKGEGAYLWDTDGARYTDALSGIAVCGLGHAHPAITQAISEQAATLMHTSNIYGIAQQQQLADRLSEITGMQRSFFCNSGAEANEAAIKLARLYGHRRGIDSPTVIVAEGAFHGRTLATLTATGNPKVHEGFSPLVEGFVRVPYDDIAAIEAVAKEHKNIVAILVEPAQGEGGIHIPQADYLARLRTLCDQNEWLLMLDEIQTGMGRTGKWMAYQHSDILPDVLTLAKGLGNGFPIGACLAQGEAADLFTAGTHGSTFGGNALACRVALTVIDTIKQDDLLTRVNSLSAHFAQGFKAKLGQHTGVSEIRVNGLLIGIQLNKPCAELVKIALDNHLLINVTAGNVIRLLPPFILTDEQADDIINTLSSLITDFLAQH